MGQRFGEVLAVKYLANASAVAACFGPSEVGLICGSRVPKNDLIG